MSQSPPLPDVRSLWQATAIERPKFGQLSGSRQFDVAIIGGGFTGLTTARYLGSKGVDVVVIEANRIGWGASGRNGGVVEGKFRVSFREIFRLYGLEVTRRMHHVAKEAVDHVGELVDAFDITAARYVANGNVHCAHTPAALKRLAEEIEWMAKVLGEKETLLSSAEIAGEITNGSFCGGTLSNHGGTIHPLNYVLGLARGVRDEGITIIEECPVLSLSAEGSGVRIETASGRVSAKQVVMATNAYSELTPATPQLRKAIVPFRSAMIATEPLHERGVQISLARGRSYSETRRMMRWFRLYEGRLIYGGRGAFGKQDSESAFQALESAVRRQFPEVAGAAITHRWSGLVALTLDRMPHLGRLSDRVVYAAGYNGLGVAMSSLMGKYAAKLVVGERPDLGPITARTLKPIPFYPLREVGVRMVAGWYQLLDAAGV